MIENDSKYHWFNKQQYASTKDLDLEDWLIELMARKYLYFHESMEFVNQSVNYFEERKSIYKGAIHEVDGHVIFNTVIKTHNFYKGAIADVLKKRSILEHGSESWDLRGFSDLEKYSDLRIDMTRSNSLIRKDFNEWLKKKNLAGDKKNQQGGHRARKQKFTKLKSNDLERWCDCGLLEYIDLSYYCFVKDIHMSAKEAGEIIFPDHDVDMYLPENKINDTTKPTFRSLFYLINQLRWQLELEIMNDIEGDIHFREYMGW